MSLVLQLMAATGKTVSQLVAELPKLAMIKQKFECSRDRIAQAVEKVATTFASEKLNRSDGTRVDFADGWVHLRASNTEPIVRIIAEGDLLRSSGTLVVEHSAREMLQPSCGALQLHDQRRYGDTRLSFYGRAAAIDAAREEEL